MTDSGYILECQNLTKRYGGLVAVDDFDLAVSEGEVVALLGDNGAGKSTVVSMISGVQKPNGGTIWFNGRDITNDGATTARAIGIETIFQDLALCDNLGAAQNIFLGRELTHRYLWMFSTLNRHVMREAAGSVLKRLDIHVDDLDRPMLSMSGGQRQAVAIARAVYWNAKFLIMDEPTAALGVPEQRKLLDLIRRLSNQGVPIILISHNMDDVFAVCSRVVVMRRGRKVLDVAAAGIGESDVVAAMMGGGQES